MVRRICCLVVILELLLACTAASARDREGELVAGGQVWTTPQAVAPLIGKLAPEFAGDLQWVNSKPLSMAGLRGHPVFIRFWNRECPMCQATAPLLNGLHNAYASRGLVVIGVHHSLTSIPDTRTEVSAAAKHLGYMFPIAIDNDWNTLGRFWLNSERNGDPSLASSPSFLIDQNGKIVWGHDGGSLELGSPADSSLRVAINRLLDNRSQRPAHAK